MSHPTGSRSKAACGTKIPPATHPIGQRTLWILLAAIGLSSILLRQAFPIVAIAAPHDDYLFITLAESLLQGRWLGDYNHLTHAKGVAYPVFLALNQLAGWPLKLTEHILYLGAALYFSHMLGRIVNARWLTIVTFMLLAFNPAPWSPVVGGRVIREGLYTSLTLLMFALALRCYILPDGTSVTQALRKHWAGLSLLGLVGGVFWLTREEGVWLLPSMGMLVVYGLMVRWRQGVAILPALAYLGLPLMVAQLPIQTVNTLNYRQYGVYHHNDFHSPDFVAAYGALSRIRHDAWQRYVVFPKDARERAYRFSAAARELKPSQRCPRCWHVAKKQLSQRIHCCEQCGHEENRDTASARVVLRCSFAVLGQFGFGVDCRLGIIVLRPANVPQVPDVHVQPLEGDARGDDAEQLVGPDLGVEQAVAERWAVDHLRLAAGY